MKPLLFALSAAFALLPIAAQARLAPPEQKMVQTVDHESDRTLALLGCRNIAALDRSYLSGIDEERQTQWQTASNRYAAL